MTRARWPGNTRRFCGPAASWRSSRRHLNDVPAPAQPEVRRPTLGQLRESRRADAPVWGTPCHRTPDRQERAARARQPRTAIRCCDLARMHTGIPVPRTPTGLAHRARLRTAPATPRRDGPMGHDHHHDPTPRPPPTHLNPYLPGSLRTTLRPRTNDSRIRSRIRSPGTGAAMVSDMPAHAHPPRSPCGGPSKDRSEN
jgi:hypothetical protein